MALSDHPAQYYVHMNVTDPSFYEDGEGYEDEGETCSLCGESIRDGEQFYTLWHPEMGRGGQVPVHEECLFKDRSPEFIEAVFGLLESLGFEIGVPN